MNAEQLRKFQVSDFMSKNVLSVGIGSSVERAVDLMVQREVGSVVVSSGEEVAGIFTERDLLKALARGRKLADTPVKEAMTPTISRINPTVGDREAAQQMIKSKGRLLVFEGKKLVGIVTASDVVKVIFRTGAVFEIDHVFTKDIVTVESRTPLKSVIRLMDAKGVGSVLVTEMKVPRAIFTERDLLNKVLYLDLGLDELAGTVATFPLVTAELGINGREAAGAMVTRHIKRLPLMKGGKLVGIVTARDLVQAYAYPFGSEDAELELQYRARYGELCPLCQTRIDEEGLCACGAGGE
jgi:CBS domain-containing protein